MPPSLSPLTYSRTDHPFHRRPLTRLALLTFLLVTLVHLAHRWLPLVNHNLSTYSAQRACLTYTPPPNQLLYYNNGPYAPNPTLLTYLTLRTSDHDARPVIAAAFPFLHSRTAPGRQPRLVTVNFHTSPDRRTFSLSATAEPTFSPFSVPPSWDLTCYDPAGPPFVLRLNSTDRLRLYAGSPDPNDPAHFTIPLTINDSPYTLDGRLTPSNTITLTLTPRTGPTTPTRDGPLWTPTHAPESEPYTERDLPY